MIRTTKHILLFQTKYKTHILEDIFFKFRTDVEFYINLICNDKLPLQKFLSTKEIPSNVLLYSSWKKVAYQTASSIIYTQIKKANNKRYKKYQKLYAILKRNSNKNAFINKRFSDLKLKPLIKSKYFTIPTISNLSILLDNSLINFQKGNCFDEFIQIRTPYLRKEDKILKLNLPIKYHKHSKKYKDWTRKKSIQLTFKNGNYFVTFFYEKEEPKLKDVSNTIAFDQGYKKLLSDSNGNHYGKELIKLYEEISNKKQGSKNFKQKLQYRDHLINEIINKINFNDISHIVIEDLKNVKFGKRSKFMNKLQRWSYSKVTNKFERLCEENGILLTKVNPAYTSQTCSNCGCVDKESRQKEHFHCQHCNFELDADFNAARNILLRGEEILNLNKFPLVQENIKLI